MSVWLWNFKDGGNLKSKNFGQESTQGKSFLKDLSMNYQWKILLNVRTQKIAKKIMKWLHCEKNIPDYG